MKGIKYHLGDREELVIEIGRETRRRQTHSPFARRLILFSLLLVIRTTAIFIVRGQLACHQRRHLDGERILVRKLRGTPPPCIADIWRASRGERPYER